MALPLALLLVCAALRCTRTAAETGANQAASSLRGARQAAATGGTGSDSEASNSSAIPGANGPAAMLEDFLPQRPPSNASGAMQAQNDCPLCYVTFYEDINYGGASTTVCGGTSSHFVGSAWNDRVSSLQLTGANGVITLYADTDFGGLRVSFTKDVRSHAFLTADGGVPSLAAYLFNDVMSSFSNSDCF